MDRAIAYVLVGRSWTFLTGPITVLLIAYYLTPVEQGYFYTFGNILGLRIFFELGLTNVILQFASHENANLQWTADGTLEGSPMAKGRLASLLRLTLVWYGIFALLVAVVLIPVGLMFFGNADPNDKTPWQWPFILLALVTAGSLFISPLYSILQGCGLVAETSGYQAGQGMVARTASWGVLLVGGGLFSAAAQQFVALIWDFWYVWYVRGRALFDLLRVPIGEHRISWTREIWPFQWKIAISWLAGYFISQLFNPILFFYYGAVVAGQMGMSLSLIGAVSSAAVAWVMTKSPQWGVLVVQKRYADLDRSFFTTFWQSFAVLALGLGLLCLVVTGLNWLGWLPLADRLAGRFLAPLPLSLLCLVVLFNHVTGSSAVYLRAHKQEPYLVLSIVIGVLVGASTVLLGIKYGVMGIILGYLLVVALVQLPFGIRIFMQKRKEWHVEENKPQPLSSQMKPISIA